MSVLVYAEQTGGKFKKSTFEAVSYARETARLLSVPCHAVVIGKIAGEEVERLGGFLAREIALRHAKEQGAQALVEARYEPGCARTCPGPSRSGQPGGQMSIGSTLRTNLSRMRTP